MISEPPKLAAPNKPCRWSGPAFLLVLFGVIAYAYAPSLRHGPRADQWAFLADTLEQDSFAGIVGKTWSYSRTRTIAPGDTQLFRPLLFVVLAAEKALFGNHFRPWQATGIVLHATACTLLFLILRRLRELSTNAETPRSVIDWLPHVLTVFFATNYAIIEQVIWSHISGYLVFAVFILTALWLLLRLFADPEPSRLRAAVLLATTWLLTLASAFTYELGQLCALCIGLFLAAVYVQKRRFRRALLLFVAFAAIVGIYQRVNQFDRHLHRFTFNNRESLADVVEKIPTDICVQNLGRYLSYVIVQPFLPLHCPCKMLPFGKLCLEEQLWRGLVAWDARGVASMVIFGVVVGLVLLGTVRLVCGGSRVALMMALSLGIAAGHVAMIVCGRLNLRPDSVHLALNPYYVYISVLFLLIAAAVPLLGLDRRRQAGPALRKAVGGMMVGLIALSIVSLDVTRGVNEQGALELQPLRALNASLSSFIRDHPTEPDLRLAVVRSHELEQLVPTINILYHRYLDATRPTYFVVQEDRRMTVVPMARWQEEHPGEEPALYPDLMCVRPGYYVFREGDRYYGVPHGEVFRFLAAEDHSSYPLSRPSMAELSALLK